MSTNSKDQGKHKGKDENNKSLEKSQDEESIYLKSTPEKILIKANLQNYTFPKDTYNEDYIGHLIEKDAYEVIIESASKVMGQSWMKKRENDKINLPTFVSVLSFISIVLMIIYMVIVWYAAQAENDIVLLSLSLVCVIGATLIAVGLSIFNFQRKMAVFKTVPEIIKEDLRELFNEENIKYSNKLEFIYNEEKTMIQINVLKVRDGLIDTQNNSNNDHRAENNNFKNRDNTQKLKNEQPSMKVDDAEVKKIVDDK